MIKLLLCSDQLFRLGWKRVFAIVGASLAFTSIGGLWLLRSLPYSTSWLEATTAGEVASRPRPEFSVGGLNFRVAEYEASPALQPFRQEFKRNCSGKQGLQAARCVAAALATQFPNGIPSDEFVTPRFDPADHLRRHLAGEPGHCLTRCAILASELLSVGIPSRIAQVLPAQGSGHTLVEVWDEVYGWAVVDPTYGGVLGTADGPVPAVRLLEAPDQITWYSLGNHVEFFPNHGKGLPKDVMIEGFRGHLLYPEPWLFLRIGARTAPWPFRARYARIGPPSFWLGPAHLLLLIAAPLLAVASLTTFLLMMMGPSLGSRLRASGSPGVGLSSWPAREGA